jgi:hypothetical protein
VLDVDVVDAELGGEPARQVLREDPAALDQDLAEAPATPCLLAQSVVELVGLEQLGLEEDRAKVRPGFLVEI